MEVLKENTPLCPARRRVILCCFSEQEVTRFWDGMQIPSVAGFPLDWISPPPTAGEWLRVLEELRPEVILGAWRMPPIPGSFVRSCPEFRYLCYFCGSLRGKISRSFLEREGIVTNWGGLAAKPVAECALMLVLACMRRVTRYAIEMHVEREWGGLGEPVPVSLFGKSVGVHGFGSVARQLLPLLQPFGCRVEFWSQGVPDTAYTEHGVRSAKSLEALFATNDVVIEAEALNPQTRYVVNTGVLGTMKPGSVFVNVGRGEALAPGAIEALAARGDVAIGLDVYDLEPLPASSPLRGMRHVTLLPHTAGPTVELYASIREQSLGCLERYLAGEPIPESIDPDNYSRMT